MPPGLCTPCALCLDVSPPHTRDARRLEAVIGHSPEASQSPAPRLPTPFERPAPALYSQGHLNPQPTAPWSPRQPVAFWDPDPPGTRTLPVLPFILPRAHHGHSRRRGRTGYPCA